MKQANRWQWILIIVAATITLIGILTGWYLFLFIWFPLGWFFGSRNNQNE